MRWACWLGVFGCGCLTIAWPVGCWLVRLVCRGGFRVVIWLYVCGLCLDGVLIVAWICILRVVLLVCLVGLIAVA